MYNENGLEAGMCVYYNAPYLENVNTWQQEKKTTNVTIEASSYMGIIKVVQKTHQLKKTPLVKTTKCFTFFRHLCISINPIIIIDTIIINTIGLLTNSMV